VVPDPIGNVNVLDDVAGRLHFTGPLMNDVADPPPMPVFAVFVTLTVPEVVVNIPLVRVRVFVTVVAIAVLTPPPVLLIVSL
jgi:hypothetical protein